MRNWRKQHLPKLETTGGGIFAPTHKQHLLLLLRSRKLKWKFEKVSFAKMSLLILNSPFTLALTFFRGGRMKKAKDPAFSKLHGIPVFACYIFFSLSRIVCFLLANVILFVNIDPSRWGTLTSHWGGWESKKQSKYQYCPWVVKYNPLSGALKTAHWHLALMETMSPSKTNPPTCQSKRLFNQQ